jgi:hypothetical protein
MHRVFMLAVALCAASLTACSGAGSMTSTVPAGNPIVGSSSAAAVPVSASPKAGTTRTPMIKTTPACVATDTCGDCGSLGTCANCNGDIADPACTDPGSSTGGGSTTGEGGGSTQVAELPGLPVGPCTQTDGTTSLPVGATLGSANVNGATTTRTVIDINQVNGLASQTIANNQTVINNYVSVGWMYLDNAGGVWFQKDPTSSWTASINLNLNAFFGIGITPPNAKNPEYIPNPPKVSAATDQLQTTKCFTKGRALVPGTLG